MVGLLALALPGIQSEGYKFINSRMVSHSIESAVEARPWLVIAAGMFLYSIGKLVATAAALTRHMRPGSIYTLLLLRDGFDIEAATQQRDPLAGLTASDAMTVDIPRLQAGLTLHSIIDQDAEETRRG